METSCLNLYECTFLGPEGAKNVPVVSISFGYAASLALSHCNTWSDSKAWQLVSISFIREVVVSA